MPLFLHHVVVRKKLHHRNIMCLFREAAALQGKIYTSMTKDAARHGKTNKNIMSVMYFCQKIPLNYTYSSFKTRKLLLMVRQRSWSGFKVT